MTDHAQRDHGDHTSASVHLRYDQDPTPYHRTVAATVSRYLPPGGRVVDVGCGVGHMLSLLTEARPDAVPFAVDLDPECIRITESRVPGVTAALGDVAEFVEHPLPWPADVVVLSHVLEHTRRPADLLESLAGQVGRWGWLVVAVPNPVRPAVMVKTALRRDYVNRGHLYSWDRPHWKNFLERILELDVVEHGSDYVQLVPERLRRRRPELVGRLESRLARALPWWSFSHIAVMRGTGPGLDGGNELDPVDPGVGRED